jgi:hypothetical protein
LPSIRCGSHIAAECEVDTRLPELRSRMSAWVKKLAFGLASALMILAALYCALAILQAGSIFTGERASFNLAFWGILMGFAVIAAVAFGVTAARVDK